jgi:hypothetical protein
MRLESGRNATGTARRDAKQARTKSSRLSLTSRRRECLEDAEEMLKRDDARKKISAKKRGKNGA